MVSRLILAAALLLGGASCAANEPDDGPSNSTEQEVSSRSAAEAEWGSNLWTAPADVAGSPNGYWPGVFDQPAMNSGPGSCGFAAVANLTVQLLSTPGVSDKPITPWDALERRSYNTMVGIYPSNAMSMLDAIFADEDLVGTDMRGTRFEWHREGYGNGAKAWKRLTESLGNGRPFIALVSYGNEGSSNFKSNHYVTVVRVGADDEVLIAHWGKYEGVSKSVFLRWWENHGVYSFSGIYPTAASRLSAAEKNGQALSSASAPEP